MRVAGAIYEALYSVKFAGKTARKGIARWLTELSSLCNALNKRAHKSPYPQKRQKMTFRVAYRSCGRVTCLRYSESQPAPLLQGLAEDWPYYHDPRKALSPVPGRLGRPACHPDIPGAQYGRSHVEILAHGTFPRLFPNEFDIWANSF